MASGVVGGAASETGTLGITVPTGSKEKSVLLDISKELLSLAVTLKCINTSVR